MAEREIPRLEPIRLQRSGPRRIAGLDARYDFAALDQAGAGIPRLWERFRERWSELPAESRAVAYGVCLELARGDGFRYLCGAELPREAELPGVFVTVELPARTYAVFAHPGHVSELRATIDAAWSGWLVEAGYRPPADSDFHLERYGEGYDVEAGLGDIELWIPVAP